MKVMLLTIMLLSTCVAIMQGQSSLITIQTGASFTITNSGNNAQLCADQIDVYGTLQGDNTSAVCSGSNVNCYGTCIPAGLPIELVSFSARLLSGKVLLSWETATEVNSYGFDIERSVHAAAWISCGFVQGAGSSATPRSYSFPDPVTEEMAAPLFYRLKMIDRDGSYEYSPVVEVRLHEIPVSAVVYPLYPNPSENRLVVPVALAEPAPVVLRFINMAGMEIQRFEFEGLAGRSYHALPVSINGLRSGTYLVEIVAGEIRETQKLKVAR